MFSGWLFASHPPFYKFFLQRYDEYFDFARKNGDNIKKVANLFVISDFCSIFANAKLHSAILKASFLCTLNFGG